MKIVIFFWKFKKSKQISNEIKNLENDLEKLKVSINKILHFLPNLALDDVPVGKDEKTNKLINEFIQETK